MSSEELPMPNPTVPRKSFTSYKSLSFDIYGTLIDWENSQAQQLSPFLNKLSDSHEVKQNRSTSDSLARVMEYFHKHQRELQAEKPDMRYDKLLAEAYKRMAIELGAPVEDEEAKLFGESVGSWSAFPDTVDAMKRLGKYYKLVPLSNVDRASFKRTNEGPLAGVNFWRVYVAEDIGSYKPDLRNFEYLLKHLDEDDKSEGGDGISKDQDLMVAQSLFHDHEPCKKMGMASVWINRKGQDLGSSSWVKQVHENGNVGYGWRYQTLGEFADEVDRQWAAQK